MSFIIPLIFTALSVTASTENPEEYILNATLADDQKVEMTLCTDTIALKDQYIYVYDVISDNGGTRRALISANNSGKFIDVIDGGSWGGECFLDNLYLTDRKNNTLTGIMNIENSNPIVSPAPEGGYTIEFTDRISVDVINHDDNETARYVLRDNQILYKILEDGTFRQSSIRPKPNDLNSFTANLLVYDYVAENEKPLSAGDLFELLKKYFPFPGK